MNTIQLLIPDLIVNKVVSSVFNSKQTNFAQQRYDIICRFIYYRLILCVM